jgi:hypothetical protein
MATNGDVIVQNTLVSAWLFGAIDAQHEQIIQQRAILVFELDHKRLVCDLNELLVVIVDPVYQPFQTIDR